MRRSSALVCVFLLIAACKGDNGSTAKAGCDSRAAERTAWIRSPNPLRPDKATPADLGMAALGDCSEKIKERQLSCGDSTMQASRDNPYLWEALDLGFTTHVCEFQQDGGLSKVEHPLDVVMGPRRGRGDKIEEMLRELGRFRDRVCKCTDAACAAEIAKGRRAYSGTMVTKIGKDAAPSADQDRRGRAIDQEFAECERRAQGK